MPKLNDYQQFIRDSNCHRAAIQERLRPLREFVEAQACEMGQGAALARLDEIEKDFAMVYGALGLAGEAGEYADKLKKHLRGDDGQVALHRDRRDDMKKELGDVAWYVGDCADALDSDLDEIVDLNRDKIAKRMADGTRKGDGDNR